MNHLSIRLAARMLRLAAVTLAVSCSFNVVAQNQAAAGVDRTTPADKPGGIATPSRDPQIEKGAYLARAGDCIACHTSAKGIPFAGGLPMKTPFGTIYSTNITPDKQHGIGNYTYDAFAKALREGIARDGHHLYPAMPYPSFSKLDNDDMRALYAYFMHEVRPAPVANHANDLMFPFNIRALMIGWNMLYRPKGIYAPDRRQSAEWNRGAYLVQGLGHCGACHTQHGIAGQEKAFDDVGNSVFLSGYSLAGWHASNLRSDTQDGLENWSSGDIVTFLQSGRTDHYAPFGAMTEVVENSTQYLNTQDLQAIATYLKQLSPAHDSDSAARDMSTRSRTVAAAQTAPLREGRITSPGALVYLNSCNACHRSDGTGAPGVFPALRGNSEVMAEDPTSLIHVVLSGSHMPSTDKRPSALAMPDFGWRLDDVQIADVLSFVRVSWGNHASAVTADQVAKIRNALRKETANQ